MKKLLLITLILFSLKSYSQTVKDTTLEYRISKMENKLESINKLNEKFENIKDKLDYQEKINTQTLNNISTQLSASSYNLTLFSVLFAIVAIAVTFYVTYIERKIINMSEENKKLLAKSEKAKNEIEELNKLIQNDVYNLFLKIKREETIHIIDRLVEIPEDIGNVATVLLTRDLTSDDFLKLKKAYLKLENNKYNEDYQLVFFQHFLHLALKDEKLQNDISNFIYGGIQYCFKNDIIKSTSDFASVLVEVGIEQFKKEINLFFQGLSNSKHKNYGEVYDVLFEQLKVRKNQFEIYSLVESVPEKRIAKINFGKILQKTYHNLSSSEATLLRDLEEMMLIQQKEEDELKQREEAQKKIKGA